MSIEKNPNVKGAARPEGGRPETAKEKVGGQVEPLTKLAERYWYRLPLDKKAFQMPAWIINRSIEFNDLIEFQEKLLEEFHDRHSFELREWIVDGHNVPVMIYGNSYPGDRWCYYVLNEKTNCYEVITDIEQYAILDEHERDVEDDFEKAYRRYKRFIRERYKKEAKK